MRLLLKLGFVFFLTLAFVQPSNGQRLLKRLKDKAQQKVEQKVEERAEKKIDEKIDKELDKVEEKLESDETKEESGGGTRTDEQRLQSLLKGVGISGEPVPVEDSYSFDHLIQMHFESFDKSGKQINSGEFITHLNPGTKSMAYEAISGNMAREGQGMFIMDAENGAMIILNDQNGKKEGIVYGIGSFFQTIGETYEQEEPDLSETPETYLANPNVSKTGKTKNIAGFKCEEYVYKDENTVSHIWITRDMRLNTKDFFSTLFKTSMYSHGMGWGYMMEASSVDQGTGEKSLMQVTRVDKNSNKRFSLGDYKITNLGSFNIPTE